MMKIPQLIIIPFFEREFPLLDNKDFQWTKSNKLMKLINQRKVIKNKSLKELPLQGNII